MQRYVWGWERYNPLETSRFPCSCHKMQNTVDIAKAKIFYKLLFETEKWQKRENLRRIKNVVSGRLQALEASVPTLVIGNAIPKSGTYLLNAIIRTLGGWQNPGLHVMSHTLVAMDEGGKSSQVYNALAADVIESMPAGITVAAHLRYDNRLSSLLASNSSIKHIFLFRDFRDIFCSFDNWMVRFDEAGHSTVTGEKQRFYRDMFNDTDSSLVYTICSMMEGEHFEGYIPWLKDPNSLCLRFEDLYSEIVDCPASGFGSNLRMIFEFLSVDSSTLDPVEFSRQVLGKGWTSSGQRNKIGQFREKFKPQHYQLLDNARFRALMQSYGYTIDPAID